MSPTFLFELKNQNSDSAVPMMLWGQVLTKSFPLTERLFQLCRHAGLAVFVTLLACLLLWAGPARALDLFPSCTLDAGGWNLSSKTLSIPAGAVSGQSLGVLATADVYVGTQTACQLISSDASLVNNAGLAVGPVFGGAYAVTGNDGLWPTSNSQIKVRVTGNGVLARFFGNDNTMQTLGSVDGRYINWGTADGYIHLKMEAIYVGSGTPVYGALATNSLPVASYGMGVYWGPTGTNYYDIFQVGGVKGDPGTITLDPGGGPSTGPVLSLSKANPFNLNVNSVRGYTLQVINTGGGASGTSIVVYDQLPPNMRYSSVDFGRNSSVSLTGVSCNPSGSVASGQLLACTISLPAGGLPASWSRAEIIIYVTPEQALAGTWQVNKASVDPTGNNAVQAPSNCTSNGVPSAGCALTEAMYVDFTKLNVSKANPAALTAGDESTYVLTVNNSGAIASGQRVVVTDELPVNLQFVSAAPLDVSGGRTPTSVNCTTQGQTLTCELTITGGVAAFGRSAFGITVKPLPAAAGTTTQNKAYVDPNGGNAAPPAGYPANCSGSNQPVAGCSVAPALKVASGILLSLNKANPATLKVGVSSDYLFTLSNTGVLPTATVLTFSEQLPPQVAFSSASPVSGGTVVPTAVDCSVVQGTVVSGQLLSCAVKLPTGGLPGLNATALFKISVVPQPASISTRVINRATVDPAGAGTPLPPDQCTDNGVPAGCAVTTALTVQPGVSLALRKTNPASLKVDQPATYLFSVVNSGALATGTSLVVYDQLPPNLQYNSAAAVSGGTVTATALSCSASGTVALGQLLTCTLMLPAGGLPPGTGSTHLSINVTPQLASAGTGLVNKAAIDPAGTNLAQIPSVCTDNDMPQQGCAVTGALVPTQDGIHLGLLKSSPGSLKAGVAGNYALTLTNTGANATAPKILFQDQLPTNVVFNSISPASGGSTSAQGASCTSSGTVAVGQLLTCTVELVGGLPAQSGSTVVLLSVTPQQAAAGQTLINKAIIDPAGGNPASAPATCTANDQPSPGCAVSSPLTVASNSPLLSLAKSNPQALMAGMSSDYQISISNAGPGPTGNTLVLYDLLPPNIAFKAITPIDGGSVQATGASCVLGTKPPGAVVGSQMWVCTVNLPPGGLPAGGSTQVLFSVTPNATAASSGASIVNRAAIDPTGNNAAMNPYNCISTDNPAGCAVSEGLKVQTSGPYLTLGKTNPAYLTGNQNNNYGLLITNRGPVTTGTSLVVYDQLPPNLQYQAASVASTGSLTPTAASCAVASGTVSTTGQLMRCTISLPPGGLQPGNSVGFNLTVMPLDGLYNVPTVNVAEIDYTGKNAAMDPNVDCVQSSIYSIGCAWTDPIYMNSVTLQFKIKRVGGGPAPTTFTLSNIKLRQSTKLSETLTLNNTTDLVSSSVLETSVTAVGGAVTADYATASADWKLSAGSCVDTNSTVSGNTDQAIPLSLPGQDRGSISFTNPIPRKFARFVCTLTVTGPLPQVSLTKINPAGLAANLGAGYGLSISNSGKVSTDTTLVFYDQLPPNLQYSGAVPASSGSVVPTALGCVPSGTVASGQLLSCTIGLPAGGLPTGGSTALQINVTPQTAAIGQSVVNKAAIDPTAGNASANPGNCTATDNPAGCAVTPALVVRASSLAISVVSSVPGNYVFTGNNGWNPQTLTLAPGSQVVAGAAQALTASAITTLNLSSTAGNMYITNASCTGMGSGATAGQASFTANSVTLDANATASGNNVSCVVRLGVGISVSLSKISVGGVGSFSFSANNGWSPQTLTTTVAGSAVSGPAQVLTQPGASLLFTEVAPAGWSLSSVNCVDSQARQSGNPAGTLAGVLKGGGQWELPGDYMKAAAVLSCTVTNTFGGFSLGGQVLIDNGLGGGTAHDGLQNGTEKGLAGVALSLSNCSGKIYASTVTDGAGRFNLGVGSAPAGQVCLQHQLPSGYIIVSVQAGSTWGTYNRIASTLSFTLSANISYSGLLFGLVPASLLTGEGQQQIQPGQSAVYAHIFTPGSSASVSISTSDAPSVSGQRWVSLPYLDLNCNAQLDAEDMVIPATQTLNVLAGQQMCLLVKVISPVDVPAQSSDRTRLVVMEVLQPVPDISIGTIIRFQVKEDLSTVSTTGAALVLLKQVRVVGNCPSSASDWQPYSTSNKASPGDYVEYLLRFSNGSSGPLTHIQIEDSVPAYTVFRSAGCGEMPLSGLQSCSVTQQPAAGGRGSIQWTLKDAVQQPVGLQAGGQGSVLYCVQVQR